MGYKDKLLSKTSKSYAYYKNSDKRRDKKEKKLREQILNLKKTYQYDYYYADFENILAKFYISPVVALPFTMEDKRCFSFMDHLAKYLRSTLPHKKPLVSVICPVYNYQKEVLDIVESVINQTYTNFELIVVDDASNDNTLDELKLLEDKRIRVISNETHMGLSYCRNMALEKAKGEYIFYIDMDNLWYEEYLESMMGAFMQLEDADAIYSGQLIFKDNYKQLQGIIFGVYNKSLLYNNNYISLSAFAHKKSLADEIKFDETMKTQEDWLFILNVAKYAKMHSIPIILSRFLNKDKRFNKRKGVNNAIEDAEIELVHEKVDNNIFKDFSQQYQLNKKVSIIIPSFKLLTDLEQCIDAILSFNSPFTDIIVVDNNSQDAVRQYLKKMSDDGKIKYIQNDINYGFTYAIEQGIDVADEDSDILLLNNDAILTKGSLEAMQYYAYNIDDAGIIVPREVLYAGDDRLNTHVPYGNHDYECDVTPSRAHKNMINIPLFFDGEILELNFAPFFCTYIKRDVYDQSIGFDSEFGRHYRSDRIFCNFVRHFLKLKLYQISDTKVYHKSRKATAKLKESNDSFDIMFVKNQWEPELGEKLGFKKPYWDE
ncbi:glycosyltransferase [Methanobrevibacter sp.]|uniref:glycosyltransferase n=1 Tax=Methanobrevibacter sp. TaxID=66852 RepID=UPI0026DFD258|nr:glycosyltransferase [Methanobrevibacter sp.]MDO5859586.1 glycosyltransferase [Methanobrevibacter sp.]